MEINCNIIDLAVYIIYLQTELINKRQIHVALKVMQNYSVYNLWNMYFDLIAVFFIIIEHLVKIITQNVPPISPCPKMFQYRFDGSEWFGLLSVRNPDYGQVLHLQVTLSLRGKPVTVSLPKKTLKKLFDKHQLFATLI